MQLCIAIFLGLLIGGCNDDDTSWSRAESMGVASSQQQSPGSIPHSSYPAEVAYHRYTGTGSISPFMQGRDSSLAIWPNSAHAHYGYPVQAMMAPRWTHMYDTHNHHALHDHASRINARRNELNQVLKELDRDQQNFQLALSSAANGLEESRRVIAMEYDSLNSFMRSVAPVQWSYPPETVYVNAYPHAQMPLFQSSPFMHGGSIQPFMGIQSVVKPTVPPVSSSQLSQPTPVTVTEVNTPSPVVYTTSTTPIVPPQPVLVQQQSQIQPQDFGTFISALLQFIETGLSLVRLSTTGKHLEAELERIKMRVMALNGTPDMINMGLTLQSLAAEVNLLLPQINALPRRTISEVWIDPLRVSSRTERDRLDQLVQQESVIKVAVSEPEQREEEINVLSSIPNMFVVATNAKTSHHRLKVLWDIRSKQLKLVAVCHQREFRKHSEKARWFLAFTCDDTGTSMRALLDRGHNLLAQSVLKVVCHSKELARRLVLDTNFRADRCFISKWANLAQGIPEPKFSRLDRFGKGAWKSLAERRGCFDTDESRISRTCT